MLTVIILNHRNDARFKNALASAKPANEVLVIEDKKPIEDFSKIRNSAMKKAKYDWIFFLDSDEVIPENAWEEFIKITQSKKYAGATIHRKDVFHGKTLEFGETGDTKILRLMNREKAKFIRPVHEVAEVDGEVVDLDVVIEHYSHQNISEFLKDVSGYAKIEAELRKKQYTKERIIFETIVFPPGKFILNYLFKLGFLDGWQGFIYAFIMSLHSLFVRIYLNDAANKKTK